MHAAFDSESDVLFHRAVADSELHSDLALRVAVDFLQYERAAALHRQVADRVTEQGEFLVGRRLLKGFIPESRGDVAGDLVAVLQTVGQARLGALEVIQGQVTYGTKQVRTGRPDAGLFLDLARTYAS